jgi:hypothetical protein
MRGAQGATAHSHDHRRVPIDQGRKSRVGRRSVAGQESCQQFTVGQAAQHSVLKERFELCIGLGRCPGRHRLVPGISGLLNVVSRRAAECCNFLQNPLSIAPPRQPHPSSRQKSVSFTAIYGHAAERFPAVSPLESRGVAWCFRTNKPVAAPTSNETAPTTRGTAYQSANDPSSR